MWNAQIIVHRPLRSLILASLALAGCQRADTPQAANQAQPPQATESRQPAASAGRQFPAYALDEIDAEDKLASLGPWFAKPIHRNVASDRFSGGHSIHLMFPAGAASIYTWPDGKVWRVRAIRGSLEKCIEASGSSQFSSAFIGAFEGGISADQLGAVVVQLQAGASDEPVTVTVGESRFDRLAGCTESMTSTAQAPRAAAQKRGTV